MAVLKVFPIHNDLAGTIRYILNAETTASDSPKNLFPTSSAGRDRYIGGVNCEAESAFEAFMEIQESFHKENGKICGHHGYLSFKAGDLSDPETAYQIAKNLIEQELGERFQVVFSTHLDKAHLHCHFVINAVSFADGKKYLGNQESLKRLRTALDELCKEHGLSVIEDPKHYGKDTRLYRAEKSGDLTWRDMLAYDIDACLQMSGDLQTFFKKLQGKGYLLKDGKHFAVSPPGFIKNGRRAYIRLRSLKDDDYTLEGIKRRLRENYVASYGVVRGGHRKRVRAKRKLPKYMAIYYRYMYRLGLLKKRPKQLSRYVVKSGQRQAESLSKKIRFMKVHNLYTEEALSAKVSELNTQISVLQKERKKLYNAKYRNEEGDPGEFNELNEKIGELKEQRRLCQSIALRPGNKGSETEVKGKENEKKAVKTRRQQQERRETDGSRSRSS